MALLATKCPKCSPPATSATTIAATIATVTCGHAKTELVVRGLPQVRWPERHSGSGAGRTKSPRSDIPAPYWCFYILRFTHHFEGRHGAWQAAFWWVGDWCCGGGRGESCLMYPRRSLSFVCQMLPLRVTMLPSGLTLQKEIDNEIEDLGCLLS